MILPGPILIIDDDIDDQEILGEAFREIGIESELLYFNRSDEVFNFLKATPKHPFLIISDVNLPGENGIDFKKRIDADPQLRQKSIPFVFLSTAISRYAIEKAYNQMTVQGFFKKSSNYSELKQLLRCMVEYWQNCYHPNMTGS
jgi:CheY-like chemotaxis protein